MKLEREQLVVKVREWLDANDWKYLEKADNGGDVMFVGGIGGLPPPYTDIQFHLHIEEDCVQCFEMLPLKIEEGKRTAIAEFITKVNYILKYGSFEMDYSDGEVRYHIAVVASSVVDSDGTVNSEVMENLLGVSAFSLGKYSKGILSVVMLGMSVDDAIKQCD